MKRVSMGGTGRGRIAIAGAAAVVTLALGAGITSAFAERVIQSADGQLVEQGQAGTDGQGGIEVIDASEGDAAAAGDATTAVDQQATDDQQITDGQQSADDQQATGDQQSDAAPESDQQAEGNKPIHAGPQLDIKGPEVKPGPDGKLPKINPPDCAREYVDESGEVASHKKLCKELSGSKTGWLPLKAGWYCFSKSASLSGRAALEGDVRIILCDGAKVTWNGGLHLCPGSKLTIYGQTEGTGELVADASGRDNDAGIGGNQCEAGAEVTICGGHVTAKGGEDAAGIGGGGDKWGFFSGDPGGNGGKLTVYGGEVKAYAKGSAAGIGGGKDSEAGCSSFSVLGGKVHAEGGDCNSYGIRISATGDDAKAEILGGEVTALGEGYRPGLESNCALTIANAKATIKGGWNGTGLQTKSLVIRDARVSVEGFGGKDAISCSPDTTKDGLSIEGDSVVDANSSSAAAIYSMAGDKKAKLDLADHLRVIDCDNGGAKAPAALRGEYCRYRKHVKVEPCDHADATYKQVEGGHQLSCKCCKCEFDVEPHEFDENGCCTVCGYQKPSPKFVEPAWEAADGIALVFRMDEQGDKAAYDDARMEIAVAGKRGRTITIDGADAKVDAEGRKLYPVQLSMIEMAEPVKATLTFDEGRTVEQEVVLADLLAADAKASSGKGSLARAVANAGCQLQRHLSAKKGLKLDVDYAVSTLSFDDALDVNGAGEALKSCAARADKGDSKFKGISMSVTFGSTAKVDLRVSCKPGTKDFSVASLWNDGVKPTREADGRYCIHIEGISPKDFGKNLDIVGNADGGFRLNLSVLSYADAIYHGEGAKPESKAAMAAVYRLWEACQ